MKIKISMLILAIILCTPTINSFGQSPEIKFRSRAMLDLGYFGYEDVNDRTYIGIDDLRLGTNIKMGKISLKLDIGIEGDKIGIDDFYFNVNLKNKTNFIIGNMIEAFSMDNIISSVDYQFNYISLPAVTLGSGRRFGAMYIHQSEHYYQAVGIHTDNDIELLFTPEKSSSAMIVATRALYRSKNKEPYFFHIGGSASLRNIDKRDGFNNVSFASASFTRMLNEDITNVNIYDANLNIKSGLELLGYTRRFMYQAEYVRADVIRTNNLPTYTIDGVYSSFSWIFGKNAKYGYDPLFAIPVRPNSGTIQTVARFDYLNANDRKSAIYGGRQANIAVGINWYFEKYFALKWSITYSFSDEHVNLVYRTNNVSSLLRAQFCL